MFRQRRHKLHGPIKKRDMDRLIADLLQRLFIIRPRHAAQDECEQGYGTSVAGITPRCE